MFSKRNRDKALREIQKYKIPSVYKSDVYKIPIGNQYIFLKMYGHKYPRMNYEVRKLLCHLGIRQPIEYCSPMKRKAFEEETLRHWKANGYNVPSIIDNPFPELLGFPILTTKFIDGMTLGELIREDDIDLKEKEKKLSSLFCEVSHRHQRALLNNDNKLFHIDSNTRNIIFAKEVIYYVDFEMGRQWESVLACASREVLKLLVSTADEMQSSFRDSLFKIFKDCYQIEEVYQFVNNSIVKRPLQRIHRLRDIKRKRKNPHKITLYDIAEYFC